MRGDFLDKKVYVKKLSKVLGFDVWLVNGKYIRKKINEDFVNFDGHHHLKFIPKNEFWIDDENKHGERHFYIKRLIVENRLMKNGMSYSEAFKRAIRVEKAERAKSWEIRKIKTKYKKRFIEGVYKKLLKEYSDKIKVWVVNGELVRDLFFVDYAEGGHDKVYRFIPKNEIWLDDDISKRERKFILIHELRERALMAVGISYFKAHKSATKIEDYCRQHTKESNKILKRELKKNNKII